MVTGSLQKKGNVWYVVLNLTDPKTGKRRQRWVSTGCTRKRDAEAKRNDILSEYNQGTYVEPSRITVGELLDRWLEDHVGLSVAESTRDWYKGIIEAHLKRELGQIPLQRLTAADVARYYRSRLEGGRKRPERNDGDRTLSGRTVNAHHAVLRMALGKAVQWGLLKVNVTDQVDAPIVEDQAADFWTPEESRRFLHVAREQAAYNYYYYALMLSTGLRPGEAAGLTWDMVDLNSQRLYVRKTLRRASTPPTFVPPKTKSSRRTVALGGTAVALLRARKKEQNELRLQLGAEYEDYNLVFTQPNGRPIHINNIQKREFQRMIKAAGVGPLTLHGLRHTHATELLIRGIHPKVVQERLGHSRISITLDTYSHVIPGMQDEAAAAVDDLVNV